jgi:hypothetical protein
MWALVAAFGAYACMYGLRKPFTAASFESVGVAAGVGIGFKAWLVIAQVLGYTLAKILGVKIIAEMRPARRAATLLGLVGAAELALVLFAVTPPPYHCAWLFLNGLSLGLVFGLVLGFLEGRCSTELLVAGLCASFILADGATKSVGASLLVAGVSELWMPAVAGSLFLGPLAGFVWMLQQVPPPSVADVEERAARRPLNGDARWALFWRYAFGLSAVTMTYVLVTILRSLRADFAPELWRGLGTSVAPSVFAKSEFWVALGVLAAHGLMVLVRNNRVAFFLGLGVSAAGLGLVGVALVAWETGRCGAFGFMVLLGFGMYLPYVAVHTTLFERLLAMTREQGNLGYLMYLADAAGYLGYVLVMTGHWIWPVASDFLGFFKLVSWVVASVSMLAIALAAVYFARGGDAEGQKFNASPADSSS